MINDNYSLGKIFDGFQSCPKCGGKGLLNADGTMNNSFEGSDSVALIPCGACQPDRVEEATCADCHRPLSKAEGGGVFTVCDTCWEAYYTQATPEELKAQRAPWNQ
jgi:ssDNA-binding Zn-finger/Zn-ribbon topoisomerase 1